MSLRRLLLTVMLLSLCCWDEAAMAACLPNTFDASIERRRQPAARQCTVDAPIPGTHITSAITQTSTLNAFNAVATRWHNVCEAIPEDGGMTSSGGSYRISWVTQSFISGAGSIASHHGIGAWDMTASGTWVLDGVTYNDPEQGWYYIAYDAIDPVDNTKDVYIGDCTCINGGFIKYFDLESLLSHEYGHMLGVGHNTNGLYGVMLSDYVADGSTFESLASCEKTDMRVKYGCQQSGALFSWIGIYGDTVLCQTENELGTVAVDLYGFSSTANYPDSAQLVASFSPAGGEGIVATYRHVGSSGYPVFEWRERGASGRLVRSGPVPRRSEAPPAAPEDSAAIDSTAWYETLETATFESPIIPPSESQCADIVVYGPADSLTLPIYNQIVADAPGLRVRKVNAPASSSQGGWDRSAQACRNAIASVVAANQAWNAYCTGTGCRSYPVDPGPELYIVGDSYIVPVTVLLQTKYLPVGVGTASAGSWQLSCTRDCRSDLLIYDVDADGLPEGPVSRIPATTAQQAVMAAAAARDVNLNRNVESGWHTAFLAGHEYGDPADAVSALNQVKGVYQGMQFTPRTLLDEASYPIIGTWNDTTAYDPRLSAFNSQVTAGVREVFGYGGFTHVNVIPGRFINFLGPYNSGRLATKSRMIAWWPACSIHQSWQSRAYSDGSTVRRMMLADTSRTMIAASVSQMDIGWFAGHRAMTLQLGTARGNAGGVGVRRSVARIAFDAVTAAAAAGDEERRSHAVSLSTWGSYVLVGRGRVPYQVSNLSAGAGRTTAAISWTEPQQDYGDADEYEIRYQAYTPLTEATFANGTLVNSQNSPTPGPGGTTHCVELTGLGTCRAYYCAIRTKDGGVWSPISNVATASTTCSGSTIAICEDGLMGGGGGGGGLLREDERTSLMSTGSILDGADNGERSLMAGPLGEQVTDVCPMEIIPVPGQSVSLYLRQAGRRPADLDFVSLGYVDHSEGAVAVPSRDSVLVGALSPVEGVLEASATSWSPDQAGELKAEAGQAVVLKLGASRGRSALVLEARNVAGHAVSDSVGIEVQRWNGKGWSLAGRMFPRAGYDRGAVEVADTSEIRLVFLKDYLVRSMAKLDVSGSFKPIPLTPVVSRLSSGASASGALQSDGEKVLVARAESLVVNFDAPVDVPTASRRYFLTVIGSTKTTDGVDADLSPALMGSAAVVWTFGLSPVHPNPSSGEVVFAYTLANECRADLRVFDVAGRLVRILVGKEQAAGPHEAIWDGRDSGGRRVPAGVYFYRLRAADWHSERKVVLL